MERYTWKECERDIKREEFKRKAKDKLDKTKQKVVNAWHNDREGVIILGTLALGGLKAVGKIAKTNEVKRQEERRDNRVYDPSLGDYWDLKKPLSNNERLEFEKRVADGEKRGDILRDMKKLKR